MAARTKGVEPERGSERAAALSRVVRLLTAVQDRTQVSDEDVSRMVADADGNGWPEVALLGLVLGVFKAEVDAGRLQDEPIDALLRRASSESNLPMTAMALACRARSAMLSETTPSHQADSDLARAAVLLESIPGPDKLSAMAHNECARACNLRDLWELELEHYAAADLQPYDDDDDEVTRLPALRINMAETQLTWLTALREIGDLEALVARAPAATEAIAQAQIATMPDSWRIDVTIFAQVLAAIAPDAARPKWRALDVPARGMFGGYVHLARALRSTDPVQALAHARVAAAAIDSVINRTAHNLALCVCAEAEQALSGADTAGLTYARHLARLRWHVRQSSLASARAMLQAERLRSEHMILSQHAFLDDLTGLGNRRGLARHLQHLRDGNVESIVVVLIDMDRFKRVNDVHGHASGDATLSRIGEVLRGAVRGGDLAVRLGGDEFLLVLEETSLDVARERAEAILEEIEAQPWDELNSGLQVTASAGIAAGEPHDYDAVARAADTALYRAKSAGANRVAVSM